MERSNSAEVNLPSEVSKLKEIVDAHVEENTDGVSYSLGITSKVFETDNISFAVWEMDARSTYYAKIEIDDHNVYETKFGEKRVGSTSLAVIFDSDLSIEEASIIKYGQEGGVFEFRINRARLGGFVTHLVEQLNAELS